MSCTKSENEISSKSTTTEALDTPVSSLITPSRGVRVNDFCETLMPNGRHPRI